MIRFTASYLPLFFQYPSTVLLVNIFDRYCGIERVPFLLFLSFFFFKEMESAFPRGARQLFRKSFSDPDVYREDSTVISILRKREHCENWNYSIQRHERTFYYLSRSYDTFLTTDRIIIMFIIYLAIPIERSQLPKQESVLR